MEATIGVHLDIPRTDFSLLKALVKKMGWSIKQEVISEKTNADTSRVNLIHRLHGSITLPEDFDYKQELTEALTSKYLKE